MTRKVVSLKNNLLDMHKEFAEIWEQVSPYTMTSVERGFALFQSVNAIIDNNIDGCFVECGVWRGGSAMIMALALMKRGLRREIVLFDTFSGMTEPSPIDKDLNNNHAIDLMNGIHGPEIAKLVIAAADLHNVRSMLEATGYDMNFIRFVVGDVRETLVKADISKIALLRLDTDFYDSTFVELNFLWPRLVVNGIFIIDDYGHWKGAKKAFDDYFSDIAFPKPLFWRIDYTGYAGVKLQGNKKSLDRRYDYRPKYFNFPNLLPLFPSSVAEDPTKVKWPYLRSNVPHIWRSDIRNKKSIKIGNASVEEAACLFTLAKQFSGLRGLEIGSHFGWTTAHLVASGLRLDCVDPAFLDLERCNQVTEVLEQVSQVGSYKLYGGLSPSIIEYVRHTEESNWSFVFIDGNHDGDGPRNDALAVIPHLSRDSIVVFHDLTSPDVERGLYEMKLAGFNTKLYLTMQILGIAWRGDVIIPEHIRDPNISEHVPPHLEKYDR